MPNNPSVFPSAEVEALYASAYERALAAWPVPYEELYIPTRFGETHVIASGPETASPLVLFHPAGCGAVIWAHNVAAFSEHFRTYAVDVIGEVNRSRATRQIGSRNELTEWVSELFDGLRIERADLIGNSFGGYLAMNTAVQAPERVRRMVLISPAATFHQMWRWYAYFMPAYGLGTGGLRKRAYDWIWQGFAAEPWIAELRDLCSQCGRPRHVPPGVLRDDELRSVKAPTLLLIGDREVIYPAAVVMRRARQLMPGLEAEIVPNANHNAEYTSPEWVNKRVLDFLCEG
jgi:pimeloyl-ACP methyl ester carboxylesterase